MSSIILYLPSKKIFYSKKEISLLRILEEHKISIEYQCRKGFCGSCRCRLISGKVDWLTEPIAFINEDEILLCCCQAKGDIEIEI